MKVVFVDTSVFYAVLDGTDPFHTEALAAFERAEAEHWELVTTNYVVHETWALLQRRLGWEAVVSFLDDLLPRCSLQWVDKSLHDTGASRCRNTRERRFSLTDAISLEYMSDRGIGHAIARDEHFARANIGMP